MTEVETRNAPRLEVVEKLAGEWAVRFPYLERQPGVCAPGAYLKATDREPYKERVRAFLDRVSEPVPA